LSVSYLLRTIPLLPVPLLVQEQLVVLVCHNSGGESPWAIKTTAISVATTKSMSTAQGNNFLVIEAHTIEDIPQVLVSLCGIWETSVWRASSNVLVHAAWSVWDGWALHLLDSTDTGEDPEIGVGQPWELGCGRLSIWAQKP